MISQTKILCKQSKALQSGYLKAINLSVLNQNVGEMSQFVSQVSIRAQDTFIKIESHSSPAIFDTKFKATN